MVRDRPFGQSIGAAIEPVLARRLGRIPARILASELAVIGYLFARRRTAAPRALSFSAYRNSSLRQMLIGILILTAVEVGPAHFLLGRASSVGAWVLTALQLYAVLWLAADWRAHTIDPIVIVDGRLWINVGVRWHASIALSELVAIELPGGATPGSYLRATAAGAPSVRLRFARPVKMIRPFGLSRRAENVGLSIDDVEAFRRAAATPNAVRALSVRGY